MIDTENFNDVNDELPYDLETVLCWNSHRGFFFGEYRSNSDHWMVVNDFAPTSAAFVEYWTALPDNPTF